MNEQRGNVLENKGVLFHSSWQSWNVLENKGSYVQNAGMLMKTKGLFWTQGQTRQASGRVPRT
jgi:hypothetical protein